MPIVAIVNASGVLPRRSTNPSAAAQDNTTQNLSQHRQPEAASAPSARRQFKVLQSRSEPAQRALAFRG